MPTLDPNSVIESVPTPDMDMKNSTMPGGDMIGGAATIPPTPSTGNMTSGMTAPLTNSINHIHNSRKNRKNNGLFK